MVEGERGMGRSRDGGPETPLLIFLLEVASVEGGGDAMAVVGVVV